MSRLTTTPASTRTTPASAGHGLPGSSPGGTPPRRRHAITPPWRYALRCVRPRSLLRILLGAALAGACSDASVTAQETPPDIDPGAYLFQDGFESGSLSHDENGVSWGGSKNVTVTDRIAHSGSHALQFFYQGTSLDRDGHAEQRFSLGRKVRELWVEYWIYYPDGSDGLGARYVHRYPDLSTNNKFLALWGGDYNQAQIDGAWMGFSTRTNDSWDGDSYFETQATERALHVINHLLRPVTRQLTDAHRGRWARFRAHFRLGAQGVVEGWLDDDLIGRYTGPVGARNGDLDYLDNGYLLGWANSGYSEDTYIFIDDVSFYTSDPGW